MPTTAKRQRSEIVSLQGNGIKSDRFLVERFSEIIPGWNRRPLDLTDFYRFCRFVGIRVRSCRLRDCFGRAFWHRRKPYIELADDTLGGELVITAYHELAHILYHAPHPEVFERTGRLWNMSKCNRQAEIVGVIAWMPDSDAWGLSAGQLMHEFGVRREVAEFRAGLDLWRE